MHIIQNYSNRTRTYTHFWKITSEKSNEINEKNQSKHNFLRHLNKMNQKKKKQTNKQHIFGK